MTTLLIAFLFTFVFFGFFIYSYAWYHRFVTQIHLAINATGGRLISVKRVVRTSQKMRMGAQSKRPPGLFTFKNMEWHITYKNSFDTLFETRCRLINGQLNWDPPLL